MFCRKVSPHQTLTILQKIYFLLSETTDLEVLDKTGG